MQRAVARQEVGLVHRHGWALCFVCICGLGGIGSISTHTRGRGATGPVFFGCAAAHEPQHVRSVAERGAKREGAERANTAKAPSQAPATAHSCPQDMVWVAGNYCPEVQQRCLEWLDPPGPYEHFRCARYASPTVCTSPQRVALQFCIDREEYVAPGESLPAAHASWTSAAATCATQGKRLCLESEWQFACEGEQMHPYPYGDGFTRDATACNIDRSNLGRPNAGLRDLREPIDARPRCVSTFGVHNMSGNVEEWATLDHPPAAAPGAPRDRSTMKGAWWLPGRNTCRAATTGHGESYEGAQVGIRCCADALSPTAPASVHAETTST